MDSWSSPGGATRIPIVVDDDDVREVSEVALAEAGHSVRATANGSEALRCLEERPCDLLLVPDMGGPTA